MSTPVSVNVRCTTEVPTVHTFISDPTPAEQSREKCFPYILNFRDSGTASTDLIFGKLSNAILFDLNNRSA